MIDVRLNMRWETDIGPWVSGGRMCSITDLD